MKKTITLLSFLGLFGMAGFAQNLSVIQNKIGNTPVNYSSKVRVENKTPSKSTLCLDTLRYAETKEYLLGTDTYFTYNLENAASDAFSHVYLNAGTQYIQSVLVPGFRATTSAATVTLRVSIRNVVGNNLPGTTEYGTLSKTISSTTFEEHALNFVTPIAVTGNYAVVIDVANTGGVFTSFINDQIVSSYDENLAALKSTAIGTPDWINIQNLASGGYNFEPIIVPVVSYDITANFSMSHTQVCLGTPVTYTNTSTPSDVASNRMTNYSVFRNYFGLNANNMGVGYDMDDTGNPIWSGTHNYTHSSSGTFEIYMLINGGFWESCQDDKINTLTVNSVPTTPSVTASGSLNLCNGATVTLISSAATGNNWSTGETTQSIVVSTAGTYTVTASASGCTSPASAPQVVTVGTTPAAPTVSANGSLALCGTGSVTLTSSEASGNVWSTGATSQSITVSTPGTYTVTTSNGGCISPASSDQVVTVNALDDATFAYPTTTICDGSANQTPTTSVAGTFSSTPAGLTFVNAATGEIDVNGSADGSYTVTYTTSGTCPNTSTQTITLTAAPDASFTYGSASYCTNGTNPSPVFAPGASAGVFSSAAGLSIDAAGVINLAASTAGTYTVTNAIAASGACAADDATFSVTITATPTATVSGGGTQCGTGTLAVNVALTGTGPWDVTYSDGTTTNTETGITASPFVINATANGTYTVTSVSMNGCTAVGTGTATTTFNTNPTVSFTQVTDVCDNAGAVNLTATPAGGTFTGSTGVTGTSFDPAGLTGSITLTYTYTDANNCSGTATSTFTVNAAPTVTLGTFTDVCSSASSFALTGGLPAGGSYSGTAVTSGNFDPATATVGANTITYTVTENNCTASATQTITVEDCAGIADLQNFGLEVYPNPATNAVTIKTGKDVTFAMISEDGRVVYAATPLSMGTETQLNVSHLAKGVYFINFTSTEGNIVQKVMIK